MAPPHRPRRSHRWLAAALSLAAASLVARVAATDAAPARPLGGSRLWQHAKAGDLATAYANALAEGDDAMSLGIDSGLLMSRAEVRRRLDAAIASYERAGAIDPTAVEPFYRITVLLETFWSGCDFGRAACLSTSPTGDPRGLQRFIEAVDEMERRDPKDPRIDAFRFERGIAHTKLATPAHWEAARQDYLTLLASGITTVKGGGVATGNLAECEMMLGRTAESIEHYRIAVTRVGEPSMVYGLAVALDRDQRGREARDLIAALGVDAFGIFVRQVASRQTFFVPAGEVAYYLGLACEALGDPATAGDYYRAFIRSGANPQFQPQARSNLAQLAGRKPTEFTCEPLDALRERGVLP